MPAWLTITGLLTRELVRALMVPFHLLAYLPRRHHWRREAMQVLTAAPPGDGPDQAAAFGARARSHGHIFLSAGETSGEAHAVKVLRATEAAGGVTRWTSFGGPALEAAGAQLLYPLSDRAVMGVVGVLKAMPFIVGAVRRFLTLLDEDPPSLVVLVDYPGLHLVLARLAARRGIPVLHYIAPQYWAWAPWRMRRYKRCFSATLTILPFEPAFFAQAGIPSEYVGHPLLDQMADTPPPANRTETLCLLPGSRRKEITANLPGMLRVARSMREDHPDLEVVLPHVDDRRAPLIEAILGEQDAPFVRFETGPIGATLARSRVILAKSGTGSLEACLHGTPTVVVYQLGGPFSAFFSRNFLSVPWIAGANLIAGRQVVPEYCFRDPSTWDEIEASVRALWPDDEAREDCLRGIAEVRSRLGSPGASARVARWLLPFCAPKP